MEDLEKKILLRQKEHILLQLKLNDINLDLDNAEYKLSLIETKLANTDLKIETINQNYQALEKDSMKL